MSADLDGLPGADLVVAGIADSQAGRDTPDAALVRTAAPRLREIGIAVPESSSGQPGSHRLYELLSDSDPAGAYTRYNALLGRMASFASAASNVRPNADPERIRELVRELARDAREDTTIYLTGGATAVLHGWRDSTVDIDLRLEPDSDDLLLSKISRDFELDRADVEAMIEQGLVDPERLRELFEQIAPDLFRYPSLDAADFRSKVERTLSR